LRLQGETTLDFMSIKKSDLDGLIELGNKLWQINRVKTEKILRQICDEKFGPNVIKKAYNPKVKTKEEK